MSVDISVSITEDQVDIIATPTVNIVNVTNSASIDPGLYDLSEFTNTSGNPFVRTSGLSSYVPSTRSILTASPLVGGGDLSANRTISIPQATSSVNGFLSSTDWTTFNNKQNALGFTPVPDTRTLTINGVAQDLSADRSWTISTGLTVGTTPISSGTIGRVLFQGTGNVLQQSSSLFWDNTNEIFNVVGRINAKSTTAQPSSLIVEGTTGVNSGNAGFVVRTGTGYQATFFAADSLAGQGIAGLGIFSGNATPFGLQTGAPNGAFFIHNNGNIGIGTNYTNAGFRLDVNGTARVQGNAQFGTGFYWDNTNNRLGIGTSTPSNNLDVKTNVALGGISVTNTLSASFSAARVLLQADTTDISFFNQYNSASPFGLSNNGGFGSSKSIVIFSDADVASGGTSSIQFRTGGYNTAQERLRIASTGNILINTTTDAGYKLDVNGTGRVSGIFVASDRLTVGGTTIIANASVQVNGTNKFVNFNAAYLNGSFYTYQCFGGYEVFGTDSALTGLLTIGGYRASQWTGITFHSDGSERMRVATGGNVGIGTTSPSTLLHVAGNITIGGASATTVSSTYNSTTRNQIRYTNGSSFEFHEGVNERARFAPSSGNLLINTTTDAGFKLDVNGTARVSGRLDNYITGAGTSFLSGNSGAGAVRIGIYTDNSSYSAVYTEGSHDLRLATGSSVGAIANVVIFKDSNKSLGIGVSPTAKLHAKGSGSTSATSSMLIENSAGTAAMRVRDDLVILLPSLPTSSAGLPTGAIWNDGGTLKIV